MTDAVLAVHGGRCPGCNAAIRKAEDLIVEVDRRWWHTECAPEQVEEAREVETEAKDGLRW